MKDKESPGLPIAVIIVLKIEKTENSKYPKTKILKGFPAIKKLFEYRNCTKFVLVPLIIKVQPQTVAPPAGCRKT